MGFLHLEMPAKERRQNMGERQKRKILVTRMSAMGDVAMTVPVVASLLSQNADVEVVMVSTPRFAPMFAGLERFTFVGADTRKEYKGLAGIFKLFRHLRRQYRVDAVVDLHAVLRSYVLRGLYRLCGTPVYGIDKGRAEKKQLVKCGYARGRQLKTSVERYRETFERAGLNVAVDFKTLFPKNEKIELPMEVKTGKWIAVAPFAQHRGKIYPLEKMEQVVKRLSQAEGVTVLLFGGGKKEVETLEGWAGKYEHTVSVAGCYPMDMELHILNKCDVVLSMDSSNMHLASLVGTPVVSVWGATHPFAGFYGYGQKAEYALQTSLECRPCSIYGNVPCHRGDYACMEDIAVETVAGKVLEVAGVGC